MSRIGKQPITVPAGVEIKIDGAKITVKGPKGQMERSLHPEMKVTFENGVITVERPSDNKMHKSLHGLTRTLVSNMVVGVTEGFKKELEVNGVGYRVAKQGNQLVMNLGFSHQVIFTEEEGIQLDAPTPNKIIVSGYDKQRVGQIAAEIREKRPPEPYKGKGIKYIDEVIIRKEGKAGKSKK